MTNKHALQWCIGLNIYFLVSAAVSLAIGDREGFQGDMTRSAVMLAAVFIILAKK